MTKNNLSRVGFLAYGSTGEFMMAGEAGQHTVELGPFLQQQTHIEQNMK